MKLTYIHQHFVTPMGSSGTRSFDVSAHLVDLGHDVTIICGLHDQSGLAKMGWRPYKVYRFKGFKVIACNAPYSNKMSVPRRLKAHYGFALLATLAAVRESGSDLVFATSPPLETSIPAFIASRLRRIPFVFEVRDLWPEDLADAGRFRQGGLVHRLFALLERFAYRAASRIMLVSRGFHDRLLERGMPSERLQTVVLGGDGSVFKDAEKDHRYLEEHGLAGKFVAVYAGAHGDANGLEQIIEAAEMLRDRDDIAMLFIGDGKKKAALIEDVKRRGLSNVHIKDAVSKVSLAGILMACDVGLLTLKQLARPRWVTPNKLFDYMLAGLPTLVNFAGTTAELVRAEEIGAAPEPGSAEALAEAIRHYADHPEERAQTGRRAADLAWRKYDRRSVAQQLAETFESVVSSRPRK